MKIAFVTDTYFPRVNGVSTSTRTFARELSRMGHDVWIYAPSYPNAQRNIPEENVVRFPSLYLFFDPEDRLPLPWGDGKRHFLNQHFDIVHTQTPFGLGLAALRWAKRKNIPVVHTYHTLFTHYVGHYLKFLPQRFSVALVKRFSRWYVNACHLLIVPSQAMREEVENYGIETPIEILPTGIPLENLKGASGAAFRRAFGFSRDEKLLLFMGRVAREKNIDFLFHVLQDVRKKVSNVKLLVVGEGPAEKWLKTLARKMHLESHVVFIGYLDRENWRNCYAAADLFVFASLTETQGLVVTEAMTAGTPVVAVGAMGIRDVLSRGRGGIVVDADVHAFSSAVHRLLTDRKFYVQKKREAVKEAERWSSKAMARRLLRLYEKTRKGC